MNQLSYEIVEAEKKWLCATEHWALATYSVSKVAMTNHPFHKSGCQEYLLLVAKTVHDFLVVKLTIDGENFLKYLKPKIHTGENQFRKTA